MRACIKALYQQAKTFASPAGVRLFRYGLLSMWGDLRCWARNLVWSAGAFQPVGRLRGVAHIEGGALLAFEQATCEVVYLAPDLVRITWQPGRLPLPYALARAGWPGAPVAVTRSAAGVIIASDQMQVTLTPDDTLTIRDERGQVLRTERLPLRRRGEWQQATPLRPEEHLYGLGEHARPFNLRGSTHYLWNSDPMHAYRPGDGPLYMPLPVYLSLHHDGSYLVFHENPYPAHLDIDTTAERAGLLRATFSSGALRSYVIPGPPARAYARYAELTGHPAMPPRWALGYHQSRYSYYTQQEVIDVAEGFAQHDLPISAIHLDIHYMQDFHVFTVNRDRFPDLRGLAAQLRERNIHLVTIIDPAIKRDIHHWLYREGLERKVFCMTPSGCVATGPVWPGWCAFPDFSDPQVRAWWGNQYQFLLKQGVAGFWHDMNEPTITATWGQHTLAGNVLHSMEGRGGDHLEAHNQYALLMARAGYEALRREQPERRPWLLSRSGWAGLQRYSWNWTGDISGSWATLRQTVQTVLGLSLSGVPYTGPDIGGFSGHPSTELFVRWFQLGALLPFFRTHSSIETPRREPWTFGREALDILREALRLRYRLLPYYYTLAWQTHQTGLPLLRPLFWGDPTDPALWDCDDAFLLGDALLIAPVLDEGTSERTIACFPPGTWYAFWDDQQHHGSTSATVAAPLGRLPLFVRGGHLLPTSDEGRLTLHLYGPLGRGEVYTDAGDGYGDWRVDQYHWEEQDGALALRHEHTGAYPPPADDIDIVVHGFAAERARLNDQPLEQQAPGRWRLPRLDA